MYSGSPFHATIRLAKTKRSSQIKQSCLSLKYWKSDYQGAEIFFQLYFPQSYLKKY